MTGPDKGAEYQILHLHVCPFFPAPSCSQVVLGGVTRLTRSGLSMTEWKFSGKGWACKQTVLILNSLNGMRMSLVPNVWQ